GAELVLCSSLGGALRPRVVYARGGRVRVGFCGVPREGGHNPPPAAPPRRPKPDETEASHIRPGGSFLPNRSAALTAHPRLAFLRAPWTSASDPATVLPLRSSAPASTLFGPQPSQGRFFSAPNKFSPGWCAPPPSLACPEVPAIPSRRHPSCLDGAGFLPNPDAQRHSRARPQARRENPSRRRPCSQRRVPAFLCECARPECRSQQP